VLAGQPAPAELLDELTVHGDPTAARDALERWRAAGGEAPVLALPPERPLDELDHLLTELAPKTAD
jgi:alkanesulfonate monooxygenase SsuD/methylene tetrahydromethanopterin reductase-like flavin-dependent oxidoreductase (luciferase family)